jgi:hypothetical protein
MSNKIKPVIDAREKYIPSNGACTKESCLSKKEQVMKKRIFIVFFAALSALMSCDNGSQGAQSSPLGPDTGSQTNQNSGSDTGRKRLDTITSPWLDHDTYRSDTVVSENWVVSGNVSGFRFCSFLAYNNLTLLDGVGIYSSGVSQVVIKVKDTLRLGKDCRIQVRNGFYPTAPKTEIGMLDSGSLSASATLYRNVPLFPGFFGKGGNGGNGGRGTSGTLRYISKTYTIKGHGGSGGGGGGGGYGGGIGGLGGSAGSGPGGSGHDGNNGSDNGGNGGFGGAGPLVGKGGFATGVGVYPGQPQDEIGGGGSGGGGNGGDGGHGGLAGAAWGGGGSAGRGGEGGGGGGYGGGVLVIVAKTIVIDSLHPPRFVVCGQVGGRSDVQSGKNGSGGMLIIRTESKIDIPSIWNISGLMKSMTNSGGHGSVIGSPQLTMINGVRF